MSLPAVRAGAHRARTLEPGAQGLNGPPGGEIVSHQAGLAKHHPLTIEGCLYGQRGVAEMKATPIIKIAYACRGHPHAPIRPGGALGVPLDVNEVVVEEIARLAQRLLSAQQRGAANREDRVSEQAGNV